MVQVMLFHRPRLTLGLVGFLSLMGGFSNLGHGEGVEDDEEYQVATRARGKQKARATVPGAEVLASVFRFAHKVETAEKRRAEERLVSAAEEAGMKGPIQSLNSVIVLLIDYNEGQQEEMEQ